MPVADVDLRNDSPPPPGTQLPFNPITKEHILHCSVHSWHPLYRTLTPKTRLVPLPAPFLSYLRADGIMLPPDAAGEKSSGDSDSRFSGDEEDEEDEDPSVDWTETHEKIIETIRELGGRVHPKLNWSAPKDATWIAATNSMECTSANDIYLLLKSSDFVTHDLEQAFDGCSDRGFTQAVSEIPYHLVLRKSIPSVITSMEFRCFVRKRRIIGICQRDLNHYDFLSSLLPTLQEMISSFFEDKLQSTFPDDNFVFDVYIPQPKEKGRVWLMDINPWAPRTDPLLFSWLELLTMDEPEADEAEKSDEATEGLEAGVVRLMIRDGTVTSVTEGTDMDAEDLPYQAEFRIVKRDDPEAYSFNSPLYSAHKLPRDVVDASMGGGGGMQEFMTTWRTQQSEAESGRLADDDSD